MAWHRYHTFYLYPLLLNNFRLNVAGVHLLHAERGLRDGHLPFAAEQGLHLYPMATRCKVQRHLYPVNRNFFGLSYRLFNRFRIAWNVITLRQNIF